MKSVRFVEKVSFKNKEKEFKLKKIFLELMIFLDVGLELL